VAGLQRQLVLIASGASAEVRYDADDMLADAQGNLVHRRIHTGV
jgi:hypothetical protein